MAPTQIQGGTQIPREAPKKAFSRFKDVFGNIGNAKRAVTGKIPLAAGKASVALATAQAVLTLGYCTNAGFTDKSYLKAFSDSLWVLKGTYIALRKTGAFALKTGESAVSYGVAAFKALGNSPAIAGGIFTAAMAYRICKKALEGYHRGVLNEMPAGKKLAAAAGAITGNLGKIAITGYAASVLMTIRLSDIYYLLSHNPKVDQLAKQVLEQLGNPTLPYALALFSAGFAINRIVAPLYKAIKPKKPHVQKEKAPELNGAKPGESADAQKPAESAESEHPATAVEYEAATGECEAQTTGKPARQTNAGDSRENPVLVELAILRDNPECAAEYEAAMNAFVNGENPVIRFSGKFNAWYQVETPSDLFKDGTN